MSEGTSTWHTVGELSLPLPHTASRRRQTLAMGLSSSLVLIFTRTRHTSLCSSGTDWITLPMTHEFLGAFLSTSKTMSPGTKFLDTHHHFWRNWSSGKYSDNSILKNWVELVYVTAPFDRLTLLKSVDFLLEFLSLAVAYYFQFSFVKVIHCEGSFAEACFVACHNSLKLSSLLILVGVWLCNVGILLSSFNSQAQQCVPHLWDQCYCFLKAHSWGVLICQLLHYIHLFL